MVGSRMKSWIKGLVYIIALCSIKCNVYIASQKEMYSKDFVVKQNVSTFLSPPPGL